MQPLTPRSPTPVDRRAAGPIQMSGPVPTLPLMFRQIGTGEIILIVVVLVFLFGAKKLPELARSLGKSSRELRKGLKEGLEDEDEPEA